MSHITLPAATSTDVSGQCQVMSQPRVPPKLKTPQIHPPTHYFWMDTNSLSKKKVFLGAFGGGGPHDDKRHDGKMTSWALGGHGRVAPSPGFASGSRSTSLDPARSGVNRQPLACMYVHILSRFTGGWEDAVRQ